MKLRPEANQSNRDIVTRTTVGPLNPNSDGNIQSDENKGSDH